MIYNSDKNILKDVDQYSVILHQVNTKGTMQQGIGMAVNKKYPGWYSDYSGYCNWFMKDGKMNFSGKDFSDEIIGTWHRYRVKDQNIIICSAFAQQGAGKEFIQTDLDAWDTILRKLVNQTKYVNMKMNVNWTIHIPSNIGSLGKHCDNMDLLELFEKYFKNSSIDLYIHANHKI